MKLSILIPVYNEEKTVVDLLNRLISEELPAVTKQIIVIDDGSTDRTFIKLTTFIDSLPKRMITIVRHKTNLGKGAAIKTGIKKAKGEYCIIQDADLEYDPCYIKDLLIPISLGQTQVVFGTRLNRLPHFKKEERSAQFLLHYAGNRLLSLLTCVLYGQWITDMETGYKVIPTSFLKTVEIRSRGFEFEPEITAKLLLAGHKIYEVSIVTKPRGYEDGKKLQTWRDGKKALTTLLKNRFQI